MKTYEIDKVKAQLIGEPGTPQRQAYEARLAYDTMKPILFNTPMVQAILDGRKTQTRREIKPQPTKKDGWWNFQKGKESIAGNTPPESWTALTLFAPYQPGDILYVRETFNYRSKHEKYYYKADHIDSEPYAHNGWKPSIHMPAAAARIFLKVTDVKAERLTDITEADAIAEGVERFKDGWKDYRDTPTLFSTQTARGSFTTLWRSIYDFGPKEHWWQSNPYVFAYTFERIEKPAQP